MASQLPLQGLFALRVLTLLFRTVSADELPLWDWSVEQGGYELARSNGVAVSKAGDIFTLAYGRYPDDSSREDQDGPFVMKLLASGAFAASYPIALHTARGIALNDVGEIFIAGASWEGDIAVLKLHADGTLAWTFQRGTPSPDAATAIGLSDEGDIFIGGDTQGDLDGHRGFRQSSNVFAMKISANGTWAWTYMEVFSAEDDYVAGLAVTHEGDVVIVSQSQYGSLPIVVKVWADGTKAWHFQNGRNNRDFPTLSQWNSAHGIALAKGGDIVISGRSNRNLSYHGDSGYASDLLGYGCLFAMKLHSIGTHEWTFQLLDGVGTHGRGLVVNDDDEIFLAGFAWLNRMDWGSTLEYTPFLMKLLSDGSKAWQVSKFNNTETRFEDLALTNQGDVIVAGEVGGHPAPGTEDKIIVSKLCVRGTCNTDENTASTTASTDEHTASSASRMFTTWPFVMFHLLIAILLRLQQ